MTRSLYFFGDGQAEGTGDMRDILGGKGAGLAEMTAAKIPVPPGFTIATSVCLDFHKNGSRVSESFQSEQDDYLSKLEKLMGKRLGDPQDPLLVSVRSGAKFSMPGMMDTILNLGLNDGSVNGLAKKTGNERFAWDCYRRFIYMFANVVMGISKDIFEDRLEELKKEQGVKEDPQLSAEDLKTLVEGYKALVRSESGRDFPQDPREQLNLSRDAVFGSWHNPRAVYYRKQNKIPDDLGTAVNVQAMVFGNMGDDSGTGVGFTRNPSTGEKEFYGEFLLNAQGEDVVAGIRTPEPLESLSAQMPEAYHQLKAITTRLEQHYRDIQDFEFTIEREKLFLLQTRSGKRTGAAAIRIAVDMVEEGLISKQEALLRVDPAALDQLLHPQIDSTFKDSPMAQGLPASPGAAAGQAVFSADDAFAWAEQGKQVVLIRSETNPDDIHGMDAAQGILTSRGGMTSHAAVVARGMGKPCVAGCGALHVDVSKKQCVSGGVIIREGDWVTMNGSTGEVFQGQAPLSEPELTKDFATFMSWADEFRRLGVRTNADLPRDAEKAREFGAQGIGLCRTEHMFFGDDRIDLVRKMILNAGEYKALAARLELAKKEYGPDSAEAEQIEKDLAGPSKNYLGALEELLPMQREDFAGVLKAMAGFPVTIRTLDPPMHEFLPAKDEVREEIERLEAAGGSAQELSDQRQLLAQVERLHEMNPMMGHRGCRLGITFPEITVMQARAIMEAACRLTREGLEVHPEIMIPLVGHVSELEDQRREVVNTVEQVIQETGVNVPYMVGTMIEVPRAAVTADEIASSAEFFSFGTNDLTQLTLGFSRDDIATFLPEYLERGLLKEDPFVSIDQTGVGDLVRTAVSRGRTARPDIKLGICGEHGGDPESVEFFHRTGLEYVSCSPYRVPIAKLAAAQAVLKE